MCTSKDRKETTDDERQDDDHRASSELLQRSPCSSHLLRDRILCGFAVRDNDEWGNGVRIKKSYLAADDILHAAALDRKGQQRNERKDVDYWLNDSQAIS